MKHYPYSVKEVLTSYYGNDPIRTMRKRKYEDYDGEDTESSLLAMRWCLADHYAMSLFPGEYFLLDTEIRDDYIAYPYMNRTKKEVYLMFLSVPEDKGYKLDIEYIKKLSAEWTNAGYEPFIVRMFASLQHGADLKEQVCFRPAGDRFVFQPRTINGQDNFVCTIDPCWYRYEKELTAVLNQQDPVEYECLFEPDVTVICDGNELGKGIDEIRKLTDIYGTARYGYGRYKDENMFISRTYIGDLEAEITVGRRNLISKLELNETDADRIYADADPIQIPTERIPEITGIRLLDSVQTHACTLQLTYNNGSCRNYYLKTFDELDIPEEWEVSGYTFNQETAKSAAPDKDGNILFGNGYRIPRHIAYYRSYRQVRIEHPKHSHGAIKTLYREPMTQFAGPSYLGNETEPIGPMFPSLDENGNRLSDITLYRSTEHNETLDADEVYVEPTGKGGFLKKDGTWLTPPVFDRIESHQMGLACGTIENGKDKGTYLISASGAKKTSYRINADHASDLLCPFNASDEKEIYFPMPGDLYDDFENDDVNQGNWGFLNDKGEIAIPPQFVYTAGFFGSWDSAEEEYSRVGRRDEDGIVYNGVINAKGEEVIPCIYYELHSIYGDGWAFRHKDEELYGVIDLNGTIVAKPQFKYVQEYDSRHGMLSVGEGYYNVGVYSVKQQKMLTNVEYEEIEYEDTFIICNRWPGEPTDWIDYEGNLIPCGGHIEVSDQEGLLERWTEDSVYLIRFDGTPVTEPTKETWRYKQKENVAKGFYINEPTRWTKGLNSIDGKELIPPEYNEIRIEDDYVIASTNYGISTLYKTDGTVLLKGLFHNIHIDGDKITFDTPEGREHCTIIGE